MKFTAKIIDKNGNRWDVEFDSQDSGSVCRAMGYIGQSIHDGNTLAKIEYEGTPD